MLHFMITLFKIYVVCLASTMASDLTPLVTFKTLPDVQV